MTSYLVVARQTATSPELTAKIAELARAGEAARFALLVPATPINHLLTWEEGETDDAARRAATDGRIALEAAGARVTHAVVGDPSALLAIDDEIRARPGEYDAIVISTLPLGPSRWLRLDLPHRAASRFGLPVIHVIAGVPARRPRASAGVAGPQLTVERLPLVADYLATALEGRAVLPPERARRALVAIGRPSLPFLLRALDSENDQARWEAAMGLKQIASPDAIPALIRALEDPHGGVRWLAAEALAVNRGEVLIPLFRTLLERSESVWLRNGAHHILTARSARDRQELVAPVLRALEGTLPAVAVMTAANDALKFLEAPFAEAGAYA